jgi:DNA-binding response OmpR family regulator
MQETKAPESSLAPSENSHQIGLLIEQLLIALEHLPEAAAADLDNDSLRKLIGLLRTYASPVEQICIGCVCLDGDTREVVVAGRREPLTRREFDLLHALMRHPGATLSRAQLLNWVWGDARKASGNLVDVYIRYLRNKLKPLGAADCLVTIRGQGYQLQPQAAPRPPSSRR